MRYFIETCSMVIVLLVLFGAFFSGGILVFASCFFDPEVHWTKNLFAFIFGVGCLGGSIQGFKWWIGR